MAKRQTSKQELDWQADSDAHTLAEYQAIMNDKERLKRATARAEKLSEDYAQRAAMLNKSITGIKKKK